MRNPAFLDEKRISRSLYWIWLFNENERSIVEYHMGLFFNTINGSVLKTSFSFSETITRTSFAFEMIHQKCPDLYMDKNLQTLRSWYWFKLYNSCWALHKFLSAMILSISSIPSCFFISMFTSLQTLICSFASSLSLYK